MNNVDDQGNPLDVEGNLSEQPRPRHDDDDDDDMDSLTGMLCKKSHEPLIVYVVNHRLLCYVFDGHAFFPKRTSIGCVCVASTLWSVKSCGCFISASVD